MGKGAARMPVDRRGMPRIRKIAEPVITPGVVDFIQEGQPWFLRYLIRFC